MLRWFKRCASASALARRWFFAILTIIWTGSVFAEEQKIPFEISNGLIWIEVSSKHSSEPLHCILDTGAAVSLLDERVCRNFGIATRSTVPVDGVGGRTSGMWPVRADAFFAGYQLPSKMLGLDLTPVSRAAGARVDGIVGADFLKGKRLQLNFHRQVLTLSAGDQPREMLPHGVSLKRKGNVFLVPVEVNLGEREWFRVDTGCTSTLHWVSKRGVRVDGERSATIAGVRDSREKLAHVTARIGSGEAEIVEAVLHNKPLFRGEAGLLGNGYFTNYTVTLDFETAHMFLEKYSYRAAVGP